MALPQKASLAATTWTAVYTVPASTRATAKIRLANRTTAGIKCCIAVGTNTTPADADYINYDVGIPANGILEVTGIVCAAGEAVRVYADATGISVRVHGFEEAA